MTAVDPWSALRAATRARVGLGRAGDALPTGRVLELAAAHALARDAVHDALDVAPLLARFPDAVVVSSAAPDRATYLQRPDLGRRLVTRLEPSPCDLVVVLADGLSARAISSHAVGLLDALLPRLEGWRVAPVVVATQARIAIADAVGEALGAGASLVLIGERPGLSAPDSLGAYLTWGPRPGRRDSERNCVSNIRPPHGLSYGAAASTLHRLLVGARALGASGVVLKDEAQGLPGPQVKGELCLSSSPDSLGVIGPSATSLTSTTKPSCSWTIP